MGDKGDIGVAGPRGPKGERVSLTFSFKQIEPFEYQIE